jgi:hypothetical protein
MSRTETTPPHPAAGIEPPPRSAAPWRVVSVRTDEACRLHVVFVDGTAGAVHLQAFLESPAVVGTLFEPLRAAEYFRQANVDLGVVVWPNGADLAPDAMYDAIRADGQWVVAA